MSMSIRDIEAKLFGPVMTHCKVTAMVTTTLSGSFRINQ